MQPDREDDVMGASLDADIDMIIRWKRDENKDDNSKERERNRKLYTAEVESGVEMRK